MKRTLQIIVGALSILFLAACGNNNAEQEKVITVGATAGPYSDQLKNSIAKIVEEEGYTLKVVEFNDYIQPNVALDEKAIDANLYQNSNYLKNYNEEQNASFEKKFDVPTAPIALFSNKYKDIKDIKEGLTITLPNDPVNQARALKMLEKIGWIKIDPNASELSASEKDITDNPYKLKFKPLEAAALPRALDDTDFGFVNGNFAIAAGLKFEDAVALEETSQDYMIYLVVRSEDKDAEFVKVLQRAYESPAFLAYTKENLAGYVLPDYQK